MTWIDASKQKPEVYNFMANASWPVLVRTNGGMHYVSQWSLACQRWIDIPIGLVVTHWMKIPPLKE